MNDTIKKQLQKLESLDKISQLAGTGNLAAYGWMGIKNTPTDYYCQVILAVDDKLVYREESHPGHLPTHADCWQLMERILQDIDAFSIQDNLLVSKERGHKWQRITYKGMQQYANSNIMYPAQPYLY